MENSQDSAASLLEVRGISKSFGAVRALQEVDFTLRAGEIHALLGENGAGKSTLIKVVTGVFPRDAGIVRLGGEEVAPRSAKAALQAGIATVYQEVNLLPNLSVAQNLFLDRQPMRFGIVREGEMRRRAKGKEVMESFIKAEGGGKSICAVYAHNDDMMVGAIQAMKEAGLKPGKEILTVSIDAVPDIFKAMVAGEANATVELTPNMAGPALDAIAAFKDTGTVPPKWIQTESKLYTATDDPQKIYDSKKGLGY